MKTLARNKQTLYYCLYSSTERQYDSDNNETGELKVVYGPAVKMEANISAASGSAQVEMFGSDVSYDRVIVTDDVNCPIDENAVLFIDKTPEFTDEAVPTPLYNYVVSRVARSLNSVSIAISKVNVS